MFPIIVIVHQSPYSLSEGMEGKQQQMHGRVVGGRLFMLNWPLFAQLMDLPQIGKV